MTDEVNLENIDDLPINLDAVSADDNTADAQEVQIDQVEAASAPSLFRIPKNPCQDFESTGTNDHSGRIDKLRTRRRG